MDDFLVIGGGIAGLSAGAALSRLGRVRLWEAEDALGYHASGRSAAMFEQSYGLPTTIALNRASRADHAEGGYLSPRGLMLVGLRGEAELYAHTRAELSLPEIGADAARTRVPILGADVAMAAYDPDAHDLDTWRMLQDCARVVRAGGDVETGRRVTEVARVAGGWAVRAGRAEARARVLVNAAGAWADAVAALAGVAPLGLRPMRRSMARLAAPGGRDVSDWPMVMGAGERWYAKPDAGALLVSPAEEDPVAPQDAWAEDLVLAEGLARYQAAVAVPVTRPVATWAGLRTFTPDRGLALGPAPDRPDFVWVAGQGGYGFQTCWAAARLVADRVAGRTPELDAAVARALDPARFHRIPA